MTKMMFSKKKKSIDASEKKLGDLKQCLSESSINNKEFLNISNNNIHHKKSSSQIVDIKQQQHQQYLKKMNSSYNNNDLIVDNSIVVQDKNFNSKSQNAGASEIYGNNMEKHPSSAVVNNKPTFSPKNNTIKKIFKKVLEFNKKKDIDPKIYEFIKMIDHHKEFFKRSPEIDRYVMTLAFVYLKKAFPDEDITSELFFYSLYLAWETEEDSTLGLESIIHYIIGSYPSSKNKEKNQRKQEIIEWRMRLRQFHTGKDILWRALDYKTVVEYPQLQKTIKTFPNHEILKRERTNTTSIKFF
ncbi:hypothetical protein DICPUDRAFT_96142 [Dictyostelium purpureum]|uniref:Uncharacterized protein n=1 Tax=Dictyostelium purpureum TaxID=5786 RepID=F1A5F4_DICPU|nr:uncharacterized protein DICPUDRAFT_96142 [Dictyostelium purpureum]EGC28574.1 hypothetical protein DICPUDRAFT_96142 [Dictyostelium purpureum]|eukprot:XP_003294898.1 hypothetical protein DICPUDRAFT_96142 [Dictyostelium purpureum]